MELPAIQLVPLKDNAQAIVSGGCDVNMSIGMFFIRGILDGVRDGFLVVQLPWEGLEEMDRV